MRIGGVNSLAMNVSAADLFAGEVGIEIDLTADGAARAVVLSKEPSGRLVALLDLLTYSSTEQRYAA